MCDGQDMVVRNFRDLVAWQLAHELKCEVIAFTATGAASKDFKYRDQIRSSSASAPSNICEGFGRFRPREFARFLEFACGSLMETQNHLLDGRDRGYLDALLYSRLSNLARTALRTTTHLLLAKQRQAAEESRKQTDRRR
jgi:four helix bundle protein